MKIKTNANGQVDFILMSNGAKVKGSMLASEAVNLVHNGEVKKQGNTFIVNDKFIFEIDGEDVAEAPEVKEEVAEPTEETLEEVVEEVKEEDRPLTPRSKKNKKKNA